MCDGSLTLLFKDGTSCWYPNATGPYFEIGITYPSPGRFVWHWLYRILPYRKIRLPCPAAGCQTSVSIQSSENPANDVDTITFTVTVTNPAGGIAPSGTVVVKDGGVQIGTATLASCSGTSCTYTFSTTLSIGSHNISATFTGTNGWTGSSSSIVVQVVNQSVSTPCCANNMPTALHVTFSNGTSNCTCLNGVSVALTWNGIDKWTASATLCGGPATGIQFFCNNATKKFQIILQGAGGACVASATDMSGTCGASPNLSATLSVTGCCTGNATATVTT
jgi:hypothetical protein